MKESLQKRFYETEFFLLYGILSWFFEFGEMREYLVKHRVVQQLRFEFIFGIRIFRESPAQSTRPSQHPKIKCTEENLS
jgi:hypothetical protein